MTHALALIVVVSFSFGAGLLVGAYWKDEFNEFEKED